IQLEEGIQLTSYEPYQENKCDILLPCQLEKVGDVSDRLYYDDVEKAWCIEKNIEVLAKDFKFRSTTNYAQEGYFIRQITAPNKLRGSVVVSNVLPNVPLNGEVEGIYGWSTSDGSFVIKVRETTIGGNTEDLLLRYLVNNN